VIAVRLPVGLGGGAAVTGDQRGVRAAISYVPGPGQIAHAVSVRPVQQRADRAARAVLRSDLARHHRNLRGHARYLGDPAGAGVTRCPVGLVDVDGGDQLVQRVTGLVLQPAVEIAGVLRPGDHERLGRPRCPDHVDELLHPGRPEAHAGAGAAAEHAGPGGRGVPVRVGVRLVEEVEDDMVIVFEVHGQALPEGGGVVLIGHGHLAIWNGAAGRGEMQVQDRGHPERLQPGHIRGDGRPVISTGVRGLDAVDAQPAILVERYADGVDPPGRHRPYG
jgi:hypothetical protein